jgi:hypothetical protein
MDFSLIGALPRSCGPSSAIPQFLISQRSLNLADFFLYFPAQFLSSASAFQLAIIGYHTDRFFECAFGFSHCAFDLIFGAVSHNN